MALDWRRFLSQHGIEYTTTGPNASRGRVNVKCPFCGPADPSEHMGISVSGRGWSCWRNMMHRGRSNERLIQALLRCSYEEAVRLSTDAGASAPLPDGNVSQLVRGMLEPEEHDPIVRELQFPIEFKPMRPGLMVQRFFDYLKRRGYRGPMAEAVVSLYELHYATRGPQAYRLIIPVRDRYGDLMTWTGRSVLPDEELRYLTLKRDLAVVDTRDLLLGLPMLWRAPNPGTLVICEGPFDAMWVTVWGRALGVYGTCLFGLNMSDAQAALIAELGQLFNRTVLLLDGGAAFQSFRMAQNGLGLGVVRLPPTVKDPAVLSPDAMIDLCMELRPNA